MRIKLPTRADLPRYWEWAKRTATPQRGSYGLYASTVALILLSTFAIISVVDYFQTEGDILPPLKTHSDVGVKPLYTFQESLKQTTPANLITREPSMCQPLQRGWLKAENENPGIKMSPKEWKALDLFTAGQSALWLDKDSVTCGDTISIHAAATSRYNQEEGPRTFHVIRIGYYHGTGAREIWSSKPTKLVYRNTPSVKVLTRMVETKWPVTSSFVVGSDWAPGLYLVTSLSPKGVLENWAPFFLRSPPNTAKLLVINSTLTWQAYNTFGGRSAYRAPVSPKTERSKVVSFDRPYIGSGIMHIDRDAVSLTQYLESEGIEADQVTDVDITQTPHLVDGYSGIVLSGHPEYMTHSEFETLLAARNQGINIAIFGANSAYWQVRLSSSPTGANRRMAIYRDATIDPLTTTDKLTVEFGNVRINWQPSLITGEKTAGVHVKGDLNLVEKPSWLNTPSNFAIPGWPDNSEIDSQALGQAAPPHSHIFLSGPFKLKNPNSKAAGIKTRSLKAQSIWFTLPSGSAEFVAGINYWPCELSGFCVESSLKPESRTLLRSITTQILRLWETKAVGPKIDPTAYVKKTSSSKK